MLAENIVNTEYEKLPLEVVLKTKKQILDILGVMFPPTTLEKGCLALEEIAKEAGGKPESTVIGFGGKLPCSMAAFVNGSLCHPIDYDDTMDAYVNHPSAHTFPAALAVAEKVGNVTGKEFLTALALGIDLSVRLSGSPKGSLMEDYPWFPHSVFGVFSATAVAGKLLGLTVPEMINAFGIALDRGSGITESITSPDSEMRALRDGFANREGVFAALMAKKGISACKDGIEKLYKVFYKNDNDSAFLTADLGMKFWGLDVSFKAWPSCRGTHVYVKAGLDIAKQHNVDPEKIEEIILTVGSMMSDVPFSPIEEKQKPKLSINAKISLPFVMGVVFAKRRVIIEDFFPDRLIDPKVLSIAEKVKPKFDPQLPKGMLFPGTVEVRMQDGRSLIGREEFPYGHPQNPMGDEELLSKFRDCAGYSKKALSQEKIEQLAERILSLEKLERMEELTDLLV
jgi:2-methylcitrate dehydratase PrpD